jgi:UDP-N-acetylglucosamine 2-epimerase (non-hydrolysing)
MNVFLIAGARPNFMKIAPIYHASLLHPQIRCMIVHTGQHYDYEMSQAFFNDLVLPEPNYFLNGGSGTHALQTSRIMTAFEDLCKVEPPDLVIVVGDVNSTMACSIVAKKLLIQVAHVEAGLRSFDLAMPEEINRMLTDAISDYFFVTEESGVKNLLHEGKSSNRIHLVGHVMVDNLLHQLNALKNHQVSEFPSYSLKRNNPIYAFLTLHRPSNVDSRATFREIADALNTIAQEIPIFFPVHPRTRKMITEHGIYLCENIIQLPPLGFRESLFLWKDAAMVFTDSGGLQEETTALGIPCLTLRDNTERPITVEMGSNTLAGTRRDTVLHAYRTVRESGRKEYVIPPKWDGKASERIWETLLHELCWIQDKTIHND